MSSESVSLSPQPPQLQESNESQWVQDTPGNGNQNGTNLQWSELPPPEMIPVPCNEPSPTYNGQAAFNQPKFQPNGMTYMNTRNYMEPPYINDPKYNGLYLPNGARVVNGSYINGANGRPVMPNSAMINNGWMQSTPRLVTRPGWPAKPTGGVRKPKRIRTAFTSQQMMELEQEYARTRYLDRTRRIELAEVLHLNERTIKIWFQNRRMKEKKDKAESLEEEEATSTTDSSNELNGMPIVIHDQMPEYNRNVYVEEYPVTASNIVSNTTVTQAIASPVMSGYPSYAPEQVDYEQCRQVHLQMQHYPPPYGSEMQEIVQDSPPEVEEPQSVPMSAVDGNWDLSWIRSIQISDDC